MHGLTLVGLAAWEELNIAEAEQSFRTAMHGICQRGREHIYGHPGQRRAATCCTKRATSEAEELLDDSPNSDPPVDQQN